MSTALAHTIKELAGQIGYVACGITHTGPFEDDAAALAERISLFPETQPLYAPFSRRARPTDSAPWAQSIIVCLRWYGKYRLPANLANHIGRNYLADRRFAGNPDHSMPKLFHTAITRLGLRAKRISLPDRRAAVRAGVARFGRNGFAYSHEHGSWVNIESWVVDQPLPIDNPTPEPACPAGCDACLRACPTAALVKPFCMRMDRCIAWLTYSAPLPIASDLASAMGPWIYGCDACQTACPLNQGKWLDNEPMPWLENHASLLTPQALATMDQTTYEQKIHPLFWYIPRDNLARWHHNAARAMACTHHPATPSGCATGPCPL